MLALNIVDRSLTGLLQHLDNDQAAPLGFLFVEKLLESVANRDYVLRLFPLMAGCLSVYFLYRLARHCVSSPFFLAAVALFALSSPLVYYASEVKQYSVDVMVVVVLYLSAAPFIERRAGRRDLLVLGLGGVLALVFSHPALFALAGIWVTLALDYVIRKCWAGLRNMAFVGGAWAVTLTALYAISLRGISQTPVLLQYWREQFLPMPPWSQPGWIGSALQELARYPGGLSLSLLAVALGAAGVALLLARRWQWALVLTLPLAFAMAASGLHKYPFGGRLMLFAVPSVVITIAAGLEGLYVVFRSASRALAGPAAAVALILALVLLHGPALGAADGLRDPPMGEHLKPALAYLERHRQPGDTLYVYAPASFAYSYYAPFYDLRGVGVQLGGSYPRAEPKRYLQDIARLRGKGRVWFLFSHVYAGPPVDEKTYILQRVNSIGTKEDRLVLPGASLYLYQLDG